MSYERALIADGHHARVDGIASLAVLFGALGVKLRYPLADPIVGILITLIICKVVWDAVIAVFIRILDGVEPALSPQLTDTARKTEWVGGRRGSSEMVGAPADGGGDSWCPP
jgi:divalent metal cation (Fe/Co/Zn/Cd) transporter